METLNYAKLIDHTLLKPEATKDQIEKLCEEALQYQFASVCVNPAWVPFSFQMLKNSDVKVCTVVGFPLGATSTETKVFETKLAIKQGAEEIDMVINIGALKEGNNDLVEQEIKKICEAAKNKALVKVIIETALLTDEEKKIACMLAKNAGADFVKTSTGFSSGGATIEDVRLMRLVVGQEMGVKASGGVRTLEDAIAMVNAGANRIGTSSGIQIVSAQQS